MPLFSNIRRTYLGPRPYAEPSFEYLDRSARPEFQRIRDVLERWYASFPDDSGDLAARFHSTDDSQSDGAFFELYMHQLLIGLEYKIRVHPHTSSAKKTSPDFLVRDDHGREFYLEATLATDASEAERGSEARKHVVYESIERLACPNFYLALDVEGEPSTAPSGRRLRASLQKWLNSLDADALLKRKRDFESLPRLTWEHEGWKITFTAVPRSPERRGDPGLRVIGSLMPEARFLATWEAMRNSVTAKGKLYGRLDKPLVVAVNVQKFWLDRIDEMQALFGQEGYVFSRDNPGRPPRMVRQRNGIWYGPRGIQYKRISAVLIAKDVQPWTMADRDVTLYLNPWPDYSVSGPICELNRALPQEDGQMVWANGKHPREILNLPGGWPEVS